MFLVPVLREPTFWKGHWAKSFSPSRPFFLTHISFGGVLVAGKWGGDVVSLGPLLGYSGGHRGPEMEAGSKERLCPTHLQGIQVVTPLGTVLSRETSPTPALQLMPISLGLCSCRVQANGTCGEDNPFVFYVWSGLWSGLWTCGNRRDKLQLSP